eukprot:364591-Chlamydomonas_euryale.AAC.6
MSDDGLGQNQVHFMNAGAKRLRRLVADFPLLLALCRERVSEQGVGFEDETATVGSKAATVGFKDETATSVRTARISPRSQSRRRCRRRSDSRHYGARLCAFASGSAATFAATAVSRVGRDQGAIRPDSDTPTRFSCSASDAATPTAILRWGAPSSDAGIGPERQSRRARHHKFSCRRRHYRAAGAARRAGPHAAAAPWRGVAATPPKRRRRHAPVGQAGGVRAVRGYPNDHDAAVTSAAASAASTAGMAQRHLAAFADFPRRGSMSGLRHVLGGLGVRPAATASLGAALLLALLLLLLTLPPGMQLSWTRTGQAVGLPGWSPRCKAAQQLMECFNAEPTWDGRRDTFGAWLDDAPAK